MTDKSPLGPWVRRFLLEHLVAERNLSRNTQQSYRDTLRLLLPFVAGQARKPIDRLAVEDLSAGRVRAFLLGLEQERGCGVATRNQRLAAIHSLAHFIGRHSPEHVCWCGEVRAIPFKKAPQPLVSYLEKEEMDALLACPDLTTAQGRRDHAVLLFLYNSGARADEAAHVLIGDLQLGLKPESDPSSVLIRGKGNKPRRCPLWARTVSQLRGMSDADLDLLLAGLWKGTLHRQARGRGIQQPLLLLHVEYADPFFRIGFLEDGLKLTPGRDAEGRARWMGQAAPTEIGDVTLDVTTLAETLGRHKEQVARARLWVDPLLKVTGKLPTEPGTWPEGV